MMEKIFCDLFDILSEIYSFGSTVGSKAYA